MPKPHQLELEFFFSAKNLCSLKTTQRLALDKSQNLLKMGKKVTLIEVQVYDDLEAFGPKIEAAIKAKSNSLWIKMGVIYWLNDIWETVCDGGTEQLTYAAGEKPLTRKSVDELKFEVMQEYHMITNGKQPR